MNYFEYFSEIEERFSARRGSILLLSTLDWALIETWREADIPLEAVLRGIDNAFDKHDLKTQKAGSRNRKVNGLAWCSQAVMEAAEEMVEAATGTAPAKRESQESGFESERVAAFLDRNAAALDASQQANAKNTAALESIAATANRLRELAATMRSNLPVALDDLDRTLTVIEEKLFAALQTAATEQQLVDLKEQADRELAPYRSKMSTVQLRQVQTQFLHKRLLELFLVPRLSLFYIGHDA
jgi:ABC-type transporter Mla subunit MlaD